MHFKRMLKTLKYLKVGIGKFVMLLHLPNLAINHNKASLNNSDE